MILSNVNIGTGPSAGDGDPLRSAFATINTNFQIVTNNVNALSNSVTSVAGRTGNVILTTQDIVGINNYALSTSLTAANVGMKGYVDNKITANIALLVNSAPSTLDTIRELADAIGDDPNFAVNIALSVSSANTKMRDYVDGQITAANAGVTSANLGLKGYVDLANTIQSAQITAANLAITSANIGIIGYIDQANTIQASAIVAANLGMKGYVDSVAGSSYSNVNTLAYLTTNSYATQAFVNQANTSLKVYTDGQVTAANAGVTSANIGMLGYVFNANATLRSYTDGQITAANAGVTSANLGMKGYVDSLTYSNVSVKTYLENYDGSINGIGGLTLSGATYDVEIQANTAGDTKTWGFYTDGRLVLPGAINLADGQTITAPSATSIKIRGSSDDSGAVFDAAGEAEIYANANVYIYSDQAGSQKTWNFTQFGNLIFPDATTQTTAFPGFSGYATDASVTAANVGMKGYVDNAVATSGYSNVQVATYLPTYTGNVAAGNVKVSNAYRFETGNVSISNESGYVNLNPDTVYSATAGVKIGGSGYLLGPNGARNLTLNYGSTSGAVGLQANVTVGSAGSGNLFVIGNVIARDITGGNILATGTSGVIGFNSGGFVQQTTSNTTGITTSTTSGNIQLMSITLGAFALHTVAVSCNKLTTNDMFVVKHVSGGVTSVAVDAYVASDGLAVIWLRDLTGNGTGAITPMLKYAIIRAPSA